MNLENAQAQMRKGVLEMCILAIIAEADTYGKAISDRLKDAELIVVEGTLYPILSRLKNDGLLDYRWVESTEGPPRKYFKITDSGRAFLAGWVDAWSNLKRSVDQTIAHQNQPTETT